MHSGHAAWTIFGFGNFISDIFDCIHASGDRVGAIVSNVPVRPEQRADLAHRIEVQGYEIAVVDIRDFLPRDTDKYFYGFFRGRRAPIVEIKKRYGIYFSRLAHPAAHIGSNVTLGEGVIISPGAIIAPNCRIGCFTRVNRASSLGHDLSIGDFSDIAPGVSIASGVRIGDHTTIGIGATVIENVHIGNNSLIGAGAVVIDDVPDNVVVVGVPAKPLRKNPDIEAPAHVH
jgi:sugar O-acyltransferase (sialic acid O-acetyltransferase NeuD family)